MSVTTVPLRPVSKGGLWLLWIGLIVLIAAAAGVAWCQTRVDPFEVVTAGKGPSPTASDVVLINYTGRLANGTVFDQQDQAANQVSRFVPGFSKALMKMQKGGKYKIIIPPEEGYGDQATGPIPANSTLFFDVELVDFKSEAEVRAMQQMMMQQQQMQGGPGGPGGPPPGAVQP